ncbi:MAG: MXAN_2562 family outer membrane beta-barrel protein [Myxococcota bacterium]
MTRVALAVGLAVAVSAQAREIAGESERSMFLEAKLSPYTPLIDRSFTSTTGPYQTIFGGGPMLLGELELDYQFFQKVGSLGVGLSGGYAEKFGRAIDATTGAQTNQATGLKLVPLKALIVYRFDWLSLKTDIPLVPYVKGAFVMMPWWVVSGSEIEVADGLRGSGLSYGLAGVFGLSLTLDFLDPRLARDLDTSVGVNHSYLFAEFTLQEMGIFTPDAMDLSSRHWIFGLGFEF